MQSTKHKGGSMRCPFRQRKLTTFQQNKTPLYISIHNNTTAAPVLIAFTEICNDPMLFLFIRGAASVAPPLSLLICYKQQ
jgi:hypothetical protein